MKILRAKEMAALDEKAQEGYGVPGLLLMENAGMNAYRILSRWIKRQFPDGARLLFLVGKGNNGGDALVMARAALIDGFQLAIVYLQESGNEAVKLHAGICRHYGIPSMVWSREPEAVREALSSFDLAVDGILGTGVQGAPREPAASLIRALNENPICTVSLDLPSGLSDTPDCDGELGAVQADLTLCMELVKRPCLSPEGKRCSGELLTVPVGFPPSLIKSTPSTGELYYPDDLLPPSLSGESYKNSRGHLLVIGGAEGTQGAPLLSALAASNSGSGLVTLMYDRELADKAGIQQSGIMIRKLDTESCDFADAAIIGPGWGREKGRRELFLTLIDRLPGGVIDADAVVLCSEYRFSRGHDLSQGEKTWIVTPHPGEMLRLVEDLYRRSLIDGSPGNLKKRLLRDPWELLTKSAKILGVYILYKSHIPIVVAPGGETAVLVGDCPELGTAGSGDLLAGICASFLLRFQMQGFDAALHAAAAHQRAGAMAAKQLGFFNAGGLLAFVGKASHREQCHGSE